ncbi:hypothetical protein LX64_03039 [Chitinophaga skermanii]|uniref:Tetratricopeptide repeat protein n=1 Tax=Chitinophaga skermanii TaxID=331697 RepID=A0A327QIS7_9BACT|nr:hypothetical protein [Chitinophaga skermanii]RAJ04161.1 hypothetical protein LX64_03039 [Chitinophaga skermanii]
MKKVLFAIAFCFGLMNLAQAQSQFEAAMEKNVAALNSVTDPSQYQTLANTFDRIAAAEPQQWLPNYYAAYCRVMLAFSNKDADKVDALADAAGANLDKAELLQPNNSEILTVRSMIATSRINVDPMTRGPIYGREAATLLEKAKQVDPENPRVYMLQGQSAYFTPEAFGGSKERAKQLFTLSIEKFAKAKPENKIVPQWGEGYTKGLIEKLSF